MKTSEISVATAGAGSSGHAAIEALKGVTGIGYKHVTYDGGNPAVIATVSGEATVTTQLASEQAQMVRAKRLRPLAVLADTPLEIEGYGTVAPITDFEAIVIPDSGRNIGLIAPSLAFEEIVMTHDPKMLEKIEKASGRKNIRPITLLGGSTWNSIQTLESCERYCEDSVFVDGYFPDSPDPKVRDFVTAFRDATGAEPYLRETEAFDTAGLVKWVMTADAPKDRAALRAALLGMTSYVGATGKMRFEKSGEIDRELVILTIKREGHEGPVIRRWQREAAPGG
jgi:hypothetical protein